MKLPQSFTEELGRAGWQVVGDDITRDEAATRLRAFALKRENRAFLADIVQGWMRLRVDSWVKSCLGNLTAEEIAATTGTLPLPCLDLPALLETGPGRFVHQNSIVRADLRAAVVQAETKEGNASRHAARVRSLAARALPLMTDDTITLAAIAGQLREPVHAL
jgi:hypothetical protein